METAELSEVAGGTPEENAEATRSVLAGEQSPRRDLVLLNAAAAIRVGGRADLDRGRGRTPPPEAIDSGAAARVLERLVASGGER